MTAIPPEYLNQIVTGDARELAKRIPDESIGLILTSPPYNVGLKYDGFQDKMSEADFTVFNRQWILEMFRIAQDGTRAYFVISNRMMWWIKPMAEECGWKFIQHLTWCKPNMIQGNTMTSDWGIMSEPILLFRKGKRRAMQNGGTFGGRTFDWLIETSPQTNFHEGRWHPAQWPLGLCLRIIARTPGEPLLDPFCGTGTALAAAKMLGRPYIGFEISKSVAIRARKRVEMTQPPLFVVQHEQESLL